MKKMIKRMFTRLWWRYLLWSRKLTTRKNMNVSDDYESISASICRKLMTHENTKFAIAPLSEKRYIINESLGMFIVLEPDMRTVELTNHVYHYTVKMSDKTFKSIANTFDKKVEGIRVKYESEIHNQIQHSLHNVLEKLNS
jgi:hypothetical protein